MVNSPMRSGPVLGAILITTAPLQMPGEPEPIVAQETLLDADQGHNGPMDTATDVLPPAARKFLEGGISAAVQLLGPPLVTVRQGENSDVSTGFPKPSSKVAVAVMACPYASTTSSKVLMILTLPLTSVVTVIEPNIPCPSPDPLVSHCWL